VAYRVACAENAYCGPGNIGRLPIDKNSALADPIFMTLDILATIATMLIMGGLTMLMLDAVLDKD
jgi:hypothetical protein